MVLDFYSDACSGFSVHQSSNSLEVCFCTSTTLNMMQHLSPLLLFIRFQALERPQVLGACNSRLSLSNVRNKHLRKSSHVIFTTRKKGSLCAQRNINTLNFIVIQFWKERPCLNHLLQFGLWRLAIIEVVQQMFAQIPITTGLASVFLGAYRMSSRVNDPYHFIWQRDAENLQRNEPSHHQKSLHHLNMVFVPYKC